MRDENETCLIAGGAGFIGSWLCEDLLRKGYNVVCVDNFISGVKENVIELLKNKKFRLVEHDVSKELRIDKVEFIFHLASPASPVDYQRFPEETLLANSFGTYNMLKLASEKNAKFLFTSTSEVYGDPKEHPQKETYWGNVNPVGPRSCYDEGKRFAEALVMTFFRKNGTDVKIARIFNTFGPRMRKDDGRVVSNFIVQALNNDPITVYNGKQTRSFCYITDMVDALEAMMFSEDTKGEIINLGNPNEIKILELAKLIKRLTGSHSEIIFKPLPKDDPSRRKPDITKARKILKWEPKISLEDGLKRTIEWFEKKKDPNA